MSFVKRDTVTRESYELTFRVPINIETQEDGQKNVFLGEYFIFGEPAVNGTSDKDMKEFIQAEVKRIIHDAVAEMFEDDYEDGDADLICF